MKRLISLMFFGICTLLHAQLLDISVEAEIVHDGLVNPALEGFTTYRIYANLTDETDFVSAVYGELSNPMSLTCDGQIYQSEEGSDFGNQIPPGLDDADSWFTIGAENSSDGVYIFSVGLEGALNSFNQGQGFVLDPLLGAAWFVSIPCDEPCEDEHLGYGGIDHRVLLAQITANAPISGVWNIQVYLGGNTELIQQEAFSFSSIEANVFGCTNENATNYDPYAMIDDFSCVLPCSLEVNLEQVTPSDCQENEGGMIQVSSVGGQGNDYFYLDSISGIPQNFGNFVSLESGTYTVYVMDDANCVDSVFVEIPNNCSGCMDVEACNYSFTASLDDGSCDYSCCPGPGCCHAGTIWDSELQQCVVANPSDSNFDGCVQLNDLLDLLTAYGDCDAEESAWQCGDPLEYQGYDYETVQIGEQCWFAENLRAESYRNGDMIPSGLTDEYWGQAVSGAKSIYGEGTSQCYYGSCDEVENLFLYGRLYNNYSVQDGRGLCPTGWNVPSDEDWGQMELWLGMSEQDVLEEGWRTYSEDFELKSDSIWPIGAQGSNNVGFNGRPAGARSYDGHFYNGGVSTTYWTNSSLRIVRSLGLGNHGIERGVGEIWQSGFSIRCIKDTE